MAEQRNFRKLALFTLIPVLIFAVLVGLGMAIGYYLGVGTFQRKIDRYARAETLGGVLDRETRPDREEFALAYYDPAAAIRDMGTYSWSVPTAPTPFVMHAPRPGVQGVAHINSLQFRWPRELETPKPADTVRIFMTGGSTAYGSGAPSDERTIGGYVNRFLNEELAPRTGKRYEFITTATPAWSSTHERIQIENRLSELEPDMVVAFSGNNDCSWGQQGRDVLWFMSYADHFYLKLLSLAYEKSWRGELPEIQDVIDGLVEPRVITDRLEKNFRLAVLALEPTGAPYVFVLQPTLGATKKALSDRERRRIDERGNGPYFRSCYAEYQRRLPAYAAGFANTYYFDFSPMFDGDPATEEIFLDSYHFGDRGNERIARRMFESIRPILLGKK
ncbi:MAG: hypothetical protein KC466_15220 [Myxococcales bacterium]|nr:hypothetical protein [Myxococcales bacterium]